VPAVVEGRAGVQDEGSQLVALALAGAPSAGPDTRWLDMCSGPGGKAALLSALAGERGARLLATERAPHRAALVRSATRSVGAGMLGVVAADGTRPVWRSGSFDRVLLDAPCSGLGALRRRPEARWRKAAGDLPGLVRLQEALLRSALDAVRPGGAVAYVTCSPVLAETSGVVSAVLADRDDVRLEDAAPLFRDVPDLRAEQMVLPGTVQLWPHRQGTDAMFLALLRKR
jgi:16S rRNA (cytosine967-C5)-methyltransferase